MASKQPFKLIDITNRLTTWGIRINKFFKHRLLSKRKNVLLVGQNDLNSIIKDNKYYFVDSAATKLTIRYSNSIKGQTQQKKQANFQKFLIHNLYKTWQITNIKTIKQQFQSKAIPLSNKQAQSKETTQKKPSNAVQAKKQDINQQQPSTILLKSFNDKNSIATLQKYFTSKKKYFDAIILLPQNKQENYPEIQDQSFATDFINTFQEKIMKNIVAYRYSHKFLNTSGAFIQSTSQYDFVKKTNDQKQKQAKKQITDAKEDKSFTYAQKRPPSSKQLLDNSVCYLGVVVGDRDYTDLNSWTLVSLSQEASKKNPQYVAKMYYDWADGQQLPMPGSFTLFKKKIFNNNKQLNYVQYL